MIKQTSEHVLTDTIQRLFVMILTHKYSTSRSYGRSKKKKKKKKRTLRLIYSSAIDYDEGVNRVKGVRYSVKKKNIERKIKSKREYDEERRWRRHLSCFIGLHLVCGYGRIIACRGMAFAAGPEGVLGLLPACMFNEPTATTAAECFLKSSSSANEPNLT